MATEPEFVEYPRASEEPIKPWLWDRFFAYTKAGFSLMWLIRYEVQAFRTPSTIPYQVVAVATALFLIALSVFAATGRRWAFWVFAGLALVSFYGIKVQLDTGWRPDGDYPWWIATAFDVVFGTYMFLRAVGILRPSVSA